MKKITGIVLAAGSSSRMNELKILLDINGFPMLYFPIKALTNGGIDDIVVVLGRQYQDVLAYLKVFDEIQKLDIVINHDYIKGMAGSLAEGINAVENNSDAVIIMLADMPFINFKLVKQLISIYNNMKDNSCFIVPYYKEKRGHPVIIPSCYFKEIKQQRGDYGARKLLKKYSNKIFWLKVKTPAVLFDIDTKKDLNNGKTYCFN